MFEDSLGKITNNSPRQSTDSSLSENTRPENFFKSSLLDESTELEPIDDYIRYNKVKREVEEGTFLSGVASKIEDYDLNGAFFYFQNARKLKLTNLRKMRDFILLTISDWQKKYPRAFVAGDGVVLEDLQKGLIEADHVLQSSTAERLAEICQKVRFVSSQEIKKDLPAQFNLAKKEVRTAWFRAFIKDENNHDFGLALENLYEAEKSGDENFPEMKKLFIQKAERWLAIDRDNYLEKEQKARNNLRLIVENLKEL